jgi:hypothetical protein
MLIRLIESSQESARTASDPLASAQFSLISNMLLDKLSEFHKGSYEFMSKKYDLDNKKAAIRVAAE